MEQVSAARPRRWPRVVASLALVSMAWLSLTGAGIIQGSAPIDVANTTALAESVSVAKIDSAAAAYKAPYSEAISSQAGVAGHYFAFGSHEFGAAPWMLTTTASVTLSTSGDIGGAHAILIGGSKSVGDPDTIMVRGNRVFDAFNTASVVDSAYVVFAFADSAGQFYETSEKWSGEVTFERVSVATNARPVNYGLISYFDNMNQDFVLTDFRLRGVAGANDNVFRVWLRKHQDHGWDYDISGEFGMGNGPDEIVKLVTVQPTDDNLVSGRKFTWKQTGINEAITGSGAEGFYLHIETSVNNALEAGTATFFYTTP